MKAKRSGSKGRKQSSVIRPGTGSGSRPSGGSTRTSTSEPSDKRGIGRAPKGWLKKSMCPGGVARKRDSWPINRPMADLVVHP